MSTDRRLQRVVQAIEDECELLLASDAFDSWKGAEDLKAGDFVACNNSFLYREGKTTKSAYYLGLEVTDGPNFKLPPVVIKASGRINLQFKRLAARELSKYELFDLRDAVARELPELGSIVLSLAARISDPEPAEVDIGSVPGAHALRYEPQLAVPAKIEGGTISLATITHLDAAWSAVSAELGSTSIDREKLSEAFEDTFHDLQEAASREVDLAIVKADGPSILTEILERVTEQASAFSRARDLHAKKPADHDAYNEVLRIAYNFADGARTFLTLLVGICDLKPIVFWLTVFEQVDLAHRFAQLPFALVGKGKPSLDRYRSVIADARNQAFHDVFAFDHPFHVKLESGALGPSELRLFRDYSRRKEPALTYRDRELVELFETLTRTAERPVPSGFWEQNEVVITAVVELVRALRHALALVAP